MMLRHYYTLLHITRRLQTYCGAFITECYSQEKNSIVFTLELPQQEAIHLVCDCDARHGCIYLRTGLHRARANVMSCLPRLVGQRMMTVELHPNERLLRIQLDSGEYLHIIAFGTIGNVLHTSYAHIVYSAFRQQREWIGTTFSPQALVTERSSLADIAHHEFLEEYMTAVAHSDLLIGKVYAVELFQRLSALYALDLSSLDTASIRTAPLEEYAHALIEECIGSTAYHVYVHPVHPVETPPVFSLIPLRAYAEWSVMIFDDCSTAILSYRQIERRRSFIRDHIFTAQKLLRSLHTKAQRAINNITQDTSSARRLQERQRWGELLLSLPLEQTRTHGLAMIEVQDYDGTQHTIPLDPTCTIAENATHFFEKARSSRRSQAGRTQRLQIQERLIEKITLQEQALADLSSELIASLFSQNSAPTRSLHAAEKQLALIMQSSPSSGSAKSVASTQATPYREFDVGEGCTLYVGKSSENNDTLTMKFAKPNDLWLHARGVAGSHAVLRGHFPTGKPPKKVLELSASIAAYYSKARNGGYVPVAYTLKKFVRKPKGANVGAVVMDREEVIMVKPGLPVGMTDTDH
jgi:predicted ribosome quality control (RQC) complex YloA/Tae2 family protein